MWWKWLVALIVGFGFGIFAGLTILKSQAAPPIVEEPALREAGDGWISPLLDCRENDNFISPAEYAELKETLVDTIAKRKKNFHLEEVSYLFRDLNAGYRFTIDAEKKYAGGSLLKVPIMMGYLKNASETPELLNHAIEIKTYTKDWPNYIMPAVKVRPGEKRTVLELIRQMIIHSDNTAMENLIFANKARPVFSVLNDLRIPLHVDSEAKKYRMRMIDISTYASVFRILYNASYLGPKMSRLALQILSEVKYSSGIRAHLPKDFRVANKFGERSHDSNINFHDCGIVYHPVRPYLICVLTSGNFPRYQEETIAELSKITYDWVNSKR